MEAKSGNWSETSNLVKRYIPGLFSQAPLIGWLFGMLIAVALERLVGTDLALGLRLPKIPALFGFLIMLKKPLLIPSTIVYVLAIYVLPIGIVARLSASPANKLAVQLSPVLLLSKHSVFGRPLSSHLCFAFSQQFIFA